MIPVIDLFAGPGGLSEGFSSLRDRKGKRDYKIVLSIEKDATAHKTLQLRSFCRQFNAKLPTTYYEFLRGEKNIDQLYAAHPTQAPKRHNSKHCELPSANTPTRNSTSA